MTGPRTGATQSGLDGLVFEAVLFDLDGTLVDSTAAVERSWLRWAEQEQVPPGRLVGFHGVPAYAIVEALLQPDRHRAAKVRIDGLELADTAGVVALPGAVRALACLPPGRAAIATSCTRALAAARIAAAGLDVPGVVVPVDDVAAGKPAPDPYLLAAARLGVDPARCLVVEDAPSGLESARAAGCRTLAVTTTTPAQRLVADLVVGTLAEVRFTAGADGVRVGPAWVVTVVPMLFIFGTKGYVTVLGVVTFVCRACGNPAAQRIEKRVTKFTFFFVPLFAVSTSYSVQCAMCGTQSRLDRAEAERLTADVGAAQRPAGGSWGAVTGPDDRRTAG